MSVSRERVLALILVGLTILTFYLCYLLVRPFLPALAFALALAVMTHPLHRAIKRRVRWRDGAAGLAVAAVGLGVVTPLILVGRTLLVQLGTGIKLLQTELQSGHWREVLGRSPALASVIEWLESEGAQGAAAEKAGETCGGAARPTAAWPRRPSTDAQPSKNARSSVYVSSGACSAG
ncbi:MAG TPA: hypothetical protein VFR64_13035 [Methylomirabilota bacterium]|nr:hypothetical protein [Methylomirabilota bacterium]